MKSATWIKFIALIFFQCITIAILFAQTPAAQDKSATQFPTSSAYTNTNLTYKIIDAPNNTFGYDVFADGRLMIHQTSIPAMPGNEGFKTKEDAEKVAQLVVEKIKRGEMPPTISEEEMKKLNVIPLR